MKIQNKKKKYIKIDKNMWKIYLVLIIFIIVIAFLSLKIGTVDI